MNKTLKELASVEYGKSPNDIRTQDSDIPIYGTGGLLGYAKDYLFKNTMIVVGRKGTLGNPIFAEKGGWVIDTAYAVLPNQDVDPKWLFYNLCNFNLESLNEATGVPSISRDFLYKVSFETPKKIVQNKIARILTTVDTLIEKTEALIRKYESIKQGMMHDLFTRGVDETGRLRPTYAEAPHLYWKSELGWIPKGWTVEHLDNKVKIIDCKHYTPKFVEDGYAFIRPRNVQLDGLNFSDLDYVSEPDYKLLTDKHEPRKGDIVFSRNASFGVPCYVETDRKFAIGQDTVIMTQTSAKTRYLYYALLSKPTEMQVYRVSTGSTFGRINLAFIRQLLVPVPDEFEQLRIAYLLDSIVNKMVKEKEFSAKLSTIKKGLMQDLLTGKVRVQVERN